MPPLQSTEGFVRGCHPAAGVSACPTTLSARKEQGPLWSLRTLLFGRWASGAGGHAPLRLNSPVSSLVPSEVLPRAGPGGARHCTSMQGLVWRQGIPSPTQTDPWPLRDACPGALWGHAMGSAPTSNPCPGSLPPILSHGAVSKSQNHNLVEVGWHVADLLSRSRGCTSHALVEWGQQR